MNEDNAPAKESAAAPLAGNAADVSKEDKGSGAGGCCSNTKQFLLYDSAREEIQAFYFNQFGRSVLFISFMFLSLAILQLANEQAGCPQDPETGAYENCGNTVYGMQPSSMLALMAIIGGLATSIFMPYAGAVVDYSDRRLGFGKVMAILLTLVNFVQIFIYESTWFAMTILQAVVASAAFMANAMVMWSYVDAANDHDLHGVTASGRIWETLGMLGYFIVVGIVQFSTSWDDVTLARFSQALASFVGGLTLFLAYRRYQPVKAVKQLEEGKNLYVAGVSELWHTITDLGKTAPGAQRYLLATSFLAAAVGSFTNLAITYLTEQIQMNGTEIIIFILVTLISNPLGVLVHRSVSRRVGFKRSYLLVTVFFIIITALFIGIVSGPQHVNITYIFSLLYGIGFGWYYPISNGLFVSLVPPERVTELWGFNMFAAVVLSWVPPLIFTTLNESTGNLRLGLLGMIVFQVVGLFIAMTIPEKTEESAQDEDEEKGVAVKRSDTRPVESESIEVVVE